MDVSTEQPDPNKISLAFVKEFYSVLHLKPNMLHRFYGTNSSYTHRDEHQGGLAAERFVGKAAIKRQIELENYKNAKTIIKQVDACDCNGQIAVQVCGEISNNNECLRRFMQTFVLAPQRHSNNTYYVLSDIFTYVDYIWPSVDSDVVVEEGITEVDQPAVETQEPKTTTEEVKSNSSTVKEVVQPKDQPEEISEVTAETEEKPVEKKPVLVASPNAEEATSAVETLPVAETSPVVEEPPKVVAKHAEPQGSQQNAVPVKMSWADVVATKSKTEFQTPYIPKYVPKKPVNTLKSKPTAQKKKAQQHHNPTRQIYQNRGRTRNNSFIYSDSQQVFIGNLRNSMSEEEIKEHFEYYGAVIEVRMKYSADERQPNFGFVIFRDPETARVVLENRAEARNMGDFYINIEEKKRRVQIKKNRVSGDLPREKYNNDRRDSKVY